MAFVDGRQWICLDVGVARWGCRSIPRKDFEFGYASFETDGWTDGRGWYCSAVLH